MADCFVETFLVASWAERRRQHGRALAYDEELAARIRAMVIDGTTPRSTHLIAAHRGQLWFGSDARRSKR